MIDWSKPVLIGGVHEQFKLVGKLDDKQLVITTNGPQAAQTLFMVYPDGSSVRMDPHPRFGGTYYGPMFTNEPQVTTVEFFMNVFEGGKEGFPHRDIETAVAKRRESESIVTSCRATVKVTIKVDDLGNVTGSVGRA